MAFTELRYVSGETRTKKSGTSGEMEKIWGGRTPEQTDDTDEYKPEVWRHDSKVNGLSGYVYGPEITGEGE